MRRPYSMTNLLDQGVAYVMQIPLKLDYTVTIHKSQGMSLDAATVSCSGPSPRARRMSHCRGDGRERALSRWRGRWRGRRYQDAEDGHGLLRATRLAGGADEDPRRAARRRTARAARALRRYGGRPARRRARYLGPGPQLTALEAIERLEPSLDIEEEQPHVLHWQTKKPSVAREEFGGHGVGSTTKGKGGKCFLRQQVGHWAAECPN